MASSLIDSSGRWWRTRGCAETTLNACRNSLRPLTTTDEPVHIS